MNAPPKPIPTPCVLVCMINPLTGLCYGCHRTEAEIERWRDYSDKERLAVLAVLKEREKSAP